MAHQIDFSKNKSGAFYSLRANPWHGHGTVVDVPASDPRILDLAGLDWDVKLRPAWTSDRDGNPLLIPSRFGVVRDDTSAVLGSVGENYVPFQNHQMLDFFRQVCASDTVIETAGSLDDGKRVWAMARIPSLNLAIGKDVSQGYMLVTNAHDGTESLRILPTTVRVVCNNTLTSALARFNVKKSRSHITGDTANGYRIRHSASLPSNVQRVADQYAEAIAMWEGQADALRSLTLIPSEPQFVEQIANAAWKVSLDDIADETDRAKTIRTNRIASMQRIRNSETCNVDGTSGTLFSDFQAVTEFIDHDWKTDGFASAQFGEGARLKDRALEHVLEMVELNA